MSDDRHQLYERFKALIGTPQLRQEYFDEDDLLDIYDYANDRGDDFVKMEVLFYGARLFPDSESLKIRRDYLYYYLGNDDAVKMMLERRSDATTLSRILEMREADRVDRAEQLSDTLAKAGELDDEEVIQLVSAGADADNFGWLKKHYKEIEAKCTYLPTLYYELAYAGIENEDYDFAMAMAEELTMLEPFNVEFWELLAECQYDANRYNDALSSLDYSLALKPDSVKSLAMRAYALFRLDNSSVEAIELLKRVKDSPDVDAKEIVTMLALAMVNRGELPAAVEVLDEYCRAHPGEVEVLHTLLVLDSANIEKYADLLAHPAFPDDQGFWMINAAKHFIPGNERVAAAFLCEGNRRHSFTSGRELILENLYRSRQYEKAWEYYTSIPEECRRTSIEISLVGILCRVRLGDKAKARELADDAFRRFQETPVGMPGQLDFNGAEVNAVDSTLPPTTLTRCLYGYGARMALRAIKMALESPQDLPIDDYDPLA